MALHLLKLAVGVPDIEDLRARQAGRLAERDGRPVVLGYTRRRPTRAREVLAGGSIYWVIRGAVQVRQAILDLEEAADGEGRPWCRLVLDPELVATQPRPQRPLQGWRYLAPADAPPDLDRASGGELPDGLRRELMALGVW